MIPVVPVAEVAATGSPLLTPGAAAAWFWGLMAIWVGFEVRLQLVAASGPAAGPDADRHSMPALIVGVWAAVGGGLALAEWVPPARVPDPGSSLLVAGGILMGAGLALRWWAVRTLGRHFTVRVRTTADQELVQTGPYRLLRHPGYAGGLLTVAGCLVCCSDIGSLALFALPVAAYSWRVAVEERVLRQRFGPRYLEYAAGRRRLIPYLF